MADVANEIRRRHDRRYCGCPRRAGTDERRAVDENPNALIDRKQPPTDQWPLNVLLAERAKAARWSALMRPAEEYAEDQQQITKDQVTLTRLDAQLENATGAGARRIEQSRCCGAFTWRFQTAGSGGDSS